MLWADFQEPEVALSLLGERVSLLGDLEVVGVEILLDLFEKQGVRNGVVLVHPLFPSVGRLGGLDLENRVPSNFVCAAVKHEGQRTSPCYQQRMIPVLDSKENLVDYIT